MTPCTDNFRLSVHSLLVFVLLLILSLQRFFKRLFKAYDGLHIKFTTALLSSLAICWYIQDNKSIKSLLPDTFLTLTKFLIPVFRNPKKNRVGDSKALRKNISLWPENFNIIVTSNIAQNKSAKITPNVHNAKVH